MGWGGGGGSSSSIDVSFSGMVTPLGEAEGDADHTIPYGGSPTLTYEYAGEFWDGGFELEWEGEIQTPGGGGGGGGTTTREFTGWAWFGE